MPILRYRKTDGASISLATLNNSTGGVVQSISAPAPGQIVDIDVTGNEVDVDEVMATLGFTRVATDPADSLALAGAAEVPGVNAGGTPLIMGAIADGQVMARQGDDLVGVAPGGDNPSLQVRNGAQLVTTNAFQSITWNTVDTENDPTILVRNAGDQTRIDFLETGLYQVQFSATVSISGNNNSAEVRAVLNGGGAAIPGTLVPFGEGNNGGSSPVTRTFILQATANDFIQIQARFVTGNATVLANSIVTVMKIEEGAQGASLPAQDQAKIDEITQGTCKIMYPIDAGIRSPSTEVQASTNNNMPALRFLVGQDGETRWTVRAPQNHISGDLTMRLYGSIIATQNADTVWEFGYNFLNVGDNLGAYTIQSVTRDMFGIAVDDVFTIEFTMPVADFDPAADITFLRIARMGTNVNDTYTGDVWIHGFELEYTGWSVAGQPLGA